MNVYTIQGVITGGFGAATRTIPRQMPSFVDRFPELQACHPATINVRLETRLLVLRPDFQIGPVIWEANHEETFDFLRVELELPVGRPRGAAWIYVAHNSQHRDDARNHELLSVFLDGVAVGMSCAVRIFNRLEMLPYQRCPCCVVV